jgi:hypothetical protein
LYFSSLWKISVFFTPLENLCIFTTLKNLCIFHHFKIFFVSHLGRSPFTMRPPQKNFTG